VLEGQSPSKEKFFPFPLIRGRVHPEGFSLKGIKGFTQKGSP